MNISIENLNEVSAKLTVKLEKADYDEKVQKSLKTFRQKANIPGFRPGMVPMSLIKKQYGTAIKAEEINKILQEKVYDYLKTNEVDMLGEPLPNEEQQKEINFDTMDDMEFLYDIALAPKFDATLTTEDVVPYYTVKVTDEMVEGQVKMYTQHNGRYEKADDYKEGDMLKGLLCELDEAGNTKEDGLTVEEAVMMPNYMKDEAKALFAACKVGDVITFNPRDAFNNNEAELASLFKLKKEEVAGIQANFSFQISEITRYTEGELDQEIFDQVYGKDAVKTPEEFRERVKADLAVRFAPESDFKFLLDIRDYLVKRIGKLSFADDLLKKIMLSNNEEKGMEYVDENYAKTLDELTWHLVKEQLVKNAAIKIEENDVIDQAKEAVRAQFAQYGMMSIPDEMLMNYAGDMLKKKESVDGLVNRAVEARLATALKKVVKLKKKSVSVEEFNKMFE